MIIVNHNLNLKLFNSDVLVPNVLMIDRTNARTGQGSIGDHVSRCSAIYGRRINSVLIDYVDKGDPWGAERDMNGFA